MAKELNSKQTTALKINAPQPTILSLNLIGALAVTEENENYQLAKREYKKLAAQLTINNTPNFEAIFKYGTQISLLKKHVPEGIIISCLALVVGEFTQGFNVVRPLSANQIVDIAEDMAREYWGYKLEDFIAFFTLAKKGFFGKVFDRLDAGTITEMMAIYDEMRLTELVLKQTTLQEAKDNLSPYAAGDREATSIEKRLNNVSNAFSDFKGKIKRLPKNEK